MKYLPKNRIQKGLVSNGELVNKQTGEFYFGAYWKSSNGKLYKAPKNEDSKFKLEELVPVDRIDTGVQAPYTIRTAPTEAERKQGYYQRFFLKKQNEEIYYEIDRRTYKLYVDSNRRVPWQLYYPFELKWMLQDREANIRVLHDIITKSIVTRGIFLYLGIEE